MAEFMHMTGLKESVAAMRLLPRELSGNRGGPVRAGLMAAGVVLRDQARDNAPVGTGTPNPGNLKEQIFLYRDRNPGAIGATEHYILSVRTGRRGLMRLKVPGSTRALTGGDAYYWFWVEFGTSKQPGQFFMTRAFETKKIEAVRRFEVVYVRGITFAEARARRASGG